MAGGDGAGAKSAVTQSRAVLGGKFTEQMVPFFPDFKYDPTEVRFIGSPIDMVVFPGLAKGDPEEIVILEVKTGKSAQLTPPQKKIRQLIEDGMVRWDEIHQKGGRGNLAPPELPLQLRRAQPDDGRATVRAGMRIGRLLQLPHQRPHLVVA